MAPSLPSTGAVFSDDRVYRYSLSRVWDFAKPYLVVIGLNPSTADERQDDPTIRRCINFAKREHCGGYVMLNLFAFRATDPKVMKAQAEPIGADNDAAIARWSTFEHARVVAAWGTHGSYRNRDVDVCRQLAALGVVVRCFGYTRDGYPKHPLYLRSDTPIVAYSPPCLTAACRDPKTAEKACADWNARVRIGERVAVRRDDGSILETRTRSAAWVICDHASVLVDGISGGYSLERVTVRQ